VRSDGDIGLADGVRDGITGAAILVECRLFVRIRGAVRFRATRSSTVGVSKSLEKRILARAAPPFQV
jgi:hypothetical protein